MGLLTFGLLAIWVRTRSVVAAAAMPVTALWWMFTRQDVLLFVGLVLLVLAGLARRSRPHRRAVVAGLTFLYRTRGDGRPADAATKSSACRSARRWSG
ncbi:hypothetical protein EV384_3018 [Micromonospora kangleipakensis]|uniref:Uncharacterized protein n=1 Tax=Micromonospora kangleipakensis TaxID=1077942 RepID=A0A4V6MGT1_9ACTN|nr:hypothetical protein [Micromonospora kangleipakensis]RZU74546.1 hypothetical protein EV384_3018 [Micromonospora kangleipakensis]